MRKLKIYQPPKTPLLTLTRSRRSSNRMVYILAANKHQRYRDKYSKTVGRSKIIYIGTTKRGAGRPAASAVNKASEVFYKKKHLHGVKTIEVHIVTCATQNVHNTWKKLEAALLDAFRQRYFQLPKYNKVRPKHLEGLFSPNALWKIITRFHQQ